MARGLGSHTGRGATGKGHAWLSGQLGPGRLPMAVWPRGGQPVKLWLGHAGDHMARAGARMALHGLVPLAATRSRKIC